MWFGASFALLSAFLKPLQRIQRQDYQQSEHGGAWQDSVWTNGDTKRRHLSDVLTHDWDRSCESSHKVLALCLVVKGQLVENEFRF